MNINPMLHEDLEAALDQYDRAGIEAGLEPITDEVHDFVLGIGDDPIHAAAGETTDRTRERAAWLDDQDIRVCTTRDMKDALCILQEALARESLI